MEIRTNRRLSTGPVICPTRQPTPVGEQFAARSPLVPEEAQAGPSVSERDAQSASRHRVPNALPSRRQHSPVSIRLTLIVIIAGIGTIVPAIWRAWFVVRAVLAYT